MVQRARRRFRTKGGRASRRACRDTGDRLLLPNGSGTLPRVFH
jgi:hypothetical protein